MSLKIPPVVIFLITVAAMFGIYFITEEYTYTYPYRTLISRVFFSSWITFWDSRCSIVSI